VADRRISFDPTQDVPLPTEEYGEQRSLSRDEVATLADCIEPRFRATVLLAAYGGLRFGECGALRRGASTSSAVGSRSPRRCRRKWSAAHFRATQHQLWASL
jgi:hypothetical protein